MGNRVTVRVDGTEVSGHNAKIRNHRLKVGDALILRTGGGGGFGPAAARDPDSVANDVREGYVNAQFARDTYRVALSDDGHLDREATAQLRAVSVKSNLA